MKCKKIFVFGYHKDVGICGFFFFGLEHLWVLIWALAAASENFVVVIEGDGPLI